MRKLSVLMLVVIVLSASSVLWADDENLSTTTYVHFKDFSPTHGTTEVAPGTPGYTYDYDTFSFKNYTPMPPPPASATSSTSSELMIGSPHSNSLPSCPSKT